MSSSCINDGIMYDLLVAGKRRNHLFKTHDIGVIVTNTTSLNPINPDTYHRCGAHLMIIVSTIINIIIFVAVSIFKQRSCIDTILIDSVISMHIVTNNRTTPTPPKAPTISPFSLYLL